MATEKPARKAAHRERRDPTRVLEGTAGGWVQRHQFSDSERQVLQRALGPRLEEHPEASAFIVQVVAKHVHQYLHKGETVPLRHTRDRFLRARKGVDEVRQLGPEDVDRLEPYLDEVLAKGPRKLSPDEYREQLVENLDVLRVALGHAIENTRPSPSAKVSQQNKAQLIVRVALAYKAHFDGVPSADGVFGDFIEQLGDIIGARLGKRFVRSVLKPLR